MRQPAFLRFVECQRAGAAIDALSAALAEFRQEDVIFQRFDAALAQEARIFLRAPDDAAGAPGIAFVEDITLVFHPVFGAMDFAHRRCEVTGGAKVPKDVGQAAGIGSAQAVIAMIVRILPTEKRDAAGCADGILGDGVFEAAALARQAIQMRRLNIRMPLAPQRLGVVLVGNDEEDVGLGHGSIFL